MDSDAVDAVGCWTGGVGRTFHAWILDYEGGHSGNDVGLPYASKRCVGNQNEVICIADVGDAVWPTGGSEVRYLLDDSGCGDGAVGKCAERSHVNREDCRTAALAAVGRGDVEHVGRELGYTQR